MRTKHVFTGLLLALCAVACSGESSNPPPDAAAVDAPSDVATSDAAPQDVSAPDASAPDAPAPDAPAPDASVPDAPAPDAPAPDATTDAAVAPDAAGLCAMLPANTAAVIMDTYVATPMPAMSSLTGGRLAAGTYHQTAHIYHGATMGTVHTWQATMRLDESGTVAALNGMRDGAPFQQLAERLSVSGAMLTATVACPASIAGMSFVVGYNATPAEAHFFSYTDNSETVFVRQGP